jgi:hypothetical protein
MKETGEVTLETEYEKIKGMEDEEWEMVRGKLNSAADAGCRFIRNFFLFPWN